MRPELFKGRDEAVAEILGALGAKKKLVVCIHAPSGAGKTSFLRAGLVPALQMRGRPTALPEMPNEPPVLRQLLDKLASLPPGYELPVGDVAAFFDHLARLQPARDPPILILDHFEYVMRSEDCDARLAVLGRALAETAAKPLPDGRFRCQWVFAYRQEYHGAIVSWLEDVLAKVCVSDSEAEGSLPRDLTLPDYWSEYPLLPFGEPPAGGDAARSEELFLEAIEAPLGREKEDGSLRYPVLFVEGAAQKLAAAFARARVDRPRAPLVLELQAVLHRLYKTTDPDDDGIRRLHVPDDIDALIRSALHDLFHLELADALEHADRRQKHLALFALGDVAEAHLKRDGRAFVGELDKSLGSQAQIILDKLTNETRLLLKEKGEYDLREYYTLRHDSLANIVRDVFVIPAERAMYGVDEDLFALHRTVSLLVEADAQGNKRAISLSDAEYLRIQARRDALPWGEDREAWWRECEVERERQLRARALRGRRQTLVVVLALGMIGVVCAWAYVVHLPALYAPRVQNAASYVQATRAYLDWYRFPGHEDAARESLARWMAGWGLSASIQGKLEEALYWRLRALDLHEDAENRRELAYLASIVGQEKEARSSGAGALTLELWNGNTYATSDGQQVVEVRLPAGFASLTLWDMRTGIPTNEVLLPRDDDTSDRIVWAARRVAFAVGRRVVIIDRETGQATELQIPDNVVDALDMSAEGDFVVTVSKGVVRAWDAQTCRQVGPDITPNTTVYGLAVSPQSHRVVIHTAKGVDLWDPASATIVREFNGARLASNTFLSGGALATISRGGSTLVVRVEDGEEICALPSFSPRVEATPDGRFLVVVDEEGAHLRRADEARSCGEAGAPLPLPSRLDRAPVFSEDGRIAALVGESWVLFVAISPEGLEPIASRKIGKGASMASVSADPELERLWVLTQSSDAVTRTNVWSVQIVDRAPPAEGMTGEPRELLATWERELRVHAGRHGELWKQ
ncbi:hypothetical protein QHF84_43825 [Polyangium sp. y55x31]|nr:hypothetical protein [Polyangium sp. y55x31]MDI1483607.1 hypothetical protein [Polyangium sp. y55x31]